MGRAIEGDAAASLRAEAAELQAMAETARHRATAAYFRQLAHRCRELANEIEYARERDRYPIGEMAFAGHKPKPRGPDA